MLSIGDVLGRKHDNGIFGHRIFDKFDQLRRHFGTWMRLPAAVGKRFGHLSSGLSHLRSSEFSFYTFSGVEQVLDKGGSGSGSLQHLKEEVTKLDEASLQLADLMMDRATEALLRKQTRRALFGDDH